MKIDIYCNDGSPIGVTPQTVYGRGVGGAELMLVKWSKFMAKRGHKVTIFNNPENNTTSEFEGVVYTQKSNFNSQSNRDVFILFRSPNQIIKSVKANRKIHWSTDQFTIGSFENEIFPYVDNIVCISHYHVNYFKSHYKFDHNKIGYFDIGVDLNEYNQDIKKDKNKVIFCSVPDRGLSIVNEMWGTILKSNPDLELSITSDYSLWGTNVPPNNHRYRLQFAKYDNVNFLGKIPRKDLVKLQLESSYMLYPCIYEELFCIACAECQVAGAYPFTSEMGALVTTNQFGYKLKGNPLTLEWQKVFIKNFLDTVNNGYDLDELKFKSIERFNWNTICEKWETLFQKGIFE